MNEIVSTLAALDANDEELEFISYALDMAALYFSLNGEPNRAMHVKHTRYAVEKACSILDSIAVQQSVCPCYWLYTPLHFDKWRKKCQSLVVRGRRQREDEEESHGTYSKLFGRRQPRTRTAADQMLDLLEQLQMSFTNLSTILANPSEEAFCNLYEEVLLYCEERDSIVYEVSHQVMKQCSKCRHGKPCASTVEGWIENLGKQAAENGIGRALRPAGHEQSGR